MTDDDLKELAYSAHEEAMSFGLSHETFLRYFKTIRERCAQDVEAAGPKEGPLKLVSAGFAAAVRGTAGVSGTLPAFDDPRVQAVYEVLCDDAEPPNGEHWEGFAAKRIVAALGVALPEVPSERQIVRLALKHRLTGTDESDRENLLAFARELIATHGVSVPQNEPLRQSSNQRDEKE